MVRYVVLNNSRLVDAVFNPVLSAKEVQDEIQSQTGSQYQVYDTSSSTSGYKKYRDMFSVNLQGQTPLSITDQAATVLQRTWEKKLNSK